MKAFNVPLSSIGLSLVLFGADSAISSGGVTFQDIAAGIDYRRIESPRISFLEEIQARGFFYPADGFNNPLKANGAPGVAVFDYDKDGDLDIYVTNGPGRANSLYSNQYEDTGLLEFIDMAGEAGVELVTQDSTGVCFGDIDNDGDQDLLVLSSAQGNTLLANSGNGDFVDISLRADIGGAGLYSSSCSMGDINTDGLLDIAIANTYDNWDDFGPIVEFAEAVRNQDNQLFLNKGENIFEDISERAGITNYQGISWVVALVDYDIDGDADLLVADDQGAKPGEIRGGQDTGYIRVYNNDGSGQFTDVTAAVGTDRFGAWMGLAFADYNSDGHMDFFASNIGDYMGRFMENIVPFEIVPGDWNSGWFLGNSDKTFTFPNVGELKATPFGWGTLAIDYDNDTDTDIIYHGGINMGAFAEGANPGAMLNNDGNANFDLDKAALADSTNHSRREVMGVAAGDLNGDGFNDLVTVSAVDWPEPYPLAPIVNRPFNGPFDETGYIWPTFIPNNPDDLTQGFTWSGIAGAEGTLAIEISQPDNGNAWVKVDVRGSVDDLPAATVNRDGIGAVLVFKPEHNKAAMTPVVSGASYASQSDLTVIFGLGQQSTKGTLEVTWPGGVKNRLYSVSASEHITFPEIPCSYARTNVSFYKYFKCVRKSLIKLYRKNIIDSSERRRFYWSAIRAYFSERYHRQQASLD